MSAAEDDTELRDLLLQNLENSGVLSRLKAQMRAAVFLAMEEQDRVQNKVPLVNENLKNCLNTRDGRVVASLILDFLQVFDLDFSRSVFEPELGAKQLDSREVLCKDLNLNPDPKSPVLLELIQRRHQDQSKDQTRVQSKDQSKDQTRVQSKDQSKDQPRDQTRNRIKDQTRDQGSEEGDSGLKPGLNLDSGLKPGLNLDSGLKPGLNLDSGLKKDPGLDPGLDSDPQRDLDLDDGDSFFDDPLPAPQKTYGWKPESPVPSLSLGRSSSSEPSRTGASKSKGPKDSRPQSDRSTSHHPDEDVEYDDDFNSELSVGEEIEEVSIEGPEPSDKFDDSTQDLSVSHISNNSTDYMEPVL